MLFNVTGFWVCGGACIASVLRPMTVTVTSIAANKRTGGLAALMMFIRARLSDVWTPVKPRLHRDSCSSGQLSPHPAAMNVAPLVLRFANVLCASILCGPFREPFLSTRVEPRPDLILARAKRQSLQTADHVVAGPKVDAVANTRS